MVKEFYSIIVDTCSNQYLKATLTPGTFVSLEDNPYGGPMLTAPVSEAGTSADLTVYTTRQRAQDVITEYGAFGVTYEIVLLWVLRGK